RNLMESLARRCPVGYSIYQTRRNPRSVTIGDLQSISRPGTTQFRIALFLLFGRLRLRRELTGVITASRHVAVAKQARLVAGLQLGGATADQEQRHCKNPSSPQS